jgi:hypothetical protein
MPLVNVSGLWIPEMEQIIEIMRFSGSIFLMDDSGTSALDVRLCHNGMLENEPRLVRSGNSQSRLLGNSGVFQEVDVRWQLLRLSRSVRGELVWNRSKMKRFDPEFLAKNSERNLFRDPDMPA